MTGTATNRWSLLLLTLALGVGGCDDDETDLAPDPGPFDLTFQGDASFQGPHGGQPLRLAVLDAADAVVARESGTVSGTADPAFSFTFPDLLEADMSARVVYWIDSNFGGGTEGVCDPTANDHQWSVSLGPTEEDLTVTEVHAPSEVTRVCEFFAADLSFAGDASFQGAHGGQTIHVAVLRDDGTVVAEDEGTVSESEDPAFSFDFPELLLLEDEYRVHYWIDSNFGGGTEGTCDPPANDHQWDIDLGVVEEDVDHVEDHRPSETTEVCGTFE